jgi:hypothetical protein
MILILADKDGMYKRNVSELIKNIYILLVKDINNSNYKCKHWLSWLMALYLFIKDLYFIVLLYI